MDDRVLLDRFVNEGDQGAFAAVVERHATWVFAAAYRQLKDRQLAEDAVQVVFILLAQKAALMNRQKLSGWLFNTLRYTVRNIRRAGKRRVLHEQAAAMRDKNDPPPSLERVKELAEVMDDAVARLPRKYREAVLLRFYEGMGFEEVAGALAITEGAARKRVERAIEMLRGNVGPDVGSSLMSATALVGVELLSQGGAGLGGVGGMGAAASDGFIQATVQTALAAKGAGAAPATLAATVKGVGAMMTMGKVQAAVLATVAIMGVGVPMTLVGVEVATQARASDGPGGAAGAGTPAGQNAEVLADFQSAYALGKDELVKRIGPPMPESRDAGYKYLETAPNGRGSFGGGAGMQRSGPGPMPTSPTAMALEDELGKLRIRTTYWTGAGGGAMPLKQLLEALTLVPQSDIDVQKELATWSIRGDFVVRVGASNEQVLEALSTIFTEERKFPMTMTLKEVEKPVFVLTGKWNYQGGTALGEAETRRGAGPKVDGKAPETVDIYGGETLDPTWRINGGGASSGGARALVGPLSRWTGEVVIVDAVEGAPDAIGWRTYAPPGNAAANPVAHDAKSVLEHVAAQTGLKLTQETRKVKRLVVELKTQ